MTSSTNKVMRRVFSGLKKGGRTGFAAPYKIAAVLLIPLVVFAAWMTMGPVVTLSEVFKKLGYLEIVPPSTLHAPGTFNTVEYLGESSVQLHPTCEFDATALAGLTKSSDTVDSRIKEYLQLSVKGRLLSKIKANLSAEQVQSVDLSFRNMRILLLTHETLLELQEQFLKGSCEKAIVHNIRSGADVCQAEAIIQADMVYKVVFRDGLNGARREKLAKEIDASVDLSTRHQGENEFKGEGLYYGVKLSKKCLDLNPSGQAGTEIASL